VSKGCAQCVICMKTYYGRRKTHNLINKKDSFDRESLMTLRVKLPIRLKHVEIDVIKQKTIIGQALSSHSMAELRPLHTVFFAPYSCRQCLRFPGHSASSEFPIHSLKHDWVEGLYSCLEFFQMLSTQLWSNAWAFSWTNCRYECCVL